MTLTKRSIAEAFGTFWLVFGGCGAAVMSAGIPNVGIGYLGVGLAFGLILMAMAFTIGPISGCHLNPAVSLGLAVAKRFSWADLPAYIIAQTVGGTLGAALVYAIARGNTLLPPDTNILAGVCNGYAEDSPHLYTLAACFITEAALTAMFVLTILGATDKKAPIGFAPIAIGLTLTVIHYVSIPVTNCSMNPSRSTATALFAGGWALSQLWLFWVAPLAGGLVAGLVYPLISHEDSAAKRGTPAQALEPMRSPNTTPPNA